MTTKSSKKSKGPAITTVYDFNNKIPRITKQVPKTDEHYDFLEHFEEHGWAILKNCVPENMIDEAREEISKELKTRWKFDTHDNTTWHLWPFANNGFCELYHLPSFYKIRFHKPLYDVFTKLYNTDKVRVTVDRCCVKRPLYTTEGIEKKVVEHKNWYHSGFVHHDRNLLTGEEPMRIQCVIALDDTEPNQGGWQGFDKFHKIADQWVQDPKNENYRKKLEGNCKLPIFFPSTQMSKFEEITVKPKMAKGDVMVWHSTIAHGSGSNDSVDKLRQALYVNFVNAEDEKPETRRDYLDCYQSGKHPTRFDEQFNKLEMTNYVPYPLSSDFEHKLMGLMEY